MENDYRITKLHGTLIGDNRIPDLPVGEKTKVFSSTNGKTAWVDLPEGGIPIVEAEFSEELRSFILPTEQTTNFILHEESAGYFYINLIGGGAYSGFMPLPGANIAYSLSGSGTMITLSTPVVLNIVNGTIGSGDTITIPSEQTGPFILSLELIGNVYVETYEAATTKYYGLSYRKDDEGDKLLILNGEGTTLTAKTFPLSGGGATPSTSIAFQDITVSELANHVGEFGNFHITDCKIAFLLFGLESETTGVWFSGNVRSENYLGGSLWVYVSGSPGYYIFYGSGSYAINSNGKIEGGRCTVGVFNQYEFGSLQTFGNDGTFNSAAGSRSLAEVPDNGNFAYVGRINRVGGGSQQAIAFTSSVTLDATGDETYCKLSGIFTDGIGEMTFVKDTDGKPKSQKFTTWLPPVTANSDGKALIVTDGNAQWTTTPRYEHTITIKNSAGKILWTQTMRNSSNTIVNSYTNLKTLFGEATYAGFGEYCQLNLEGGTEATDKLIKADGTEVTLASLGAIVYTDKCFLPK